MRIAYLHQYFTTPDQPGGTRSFEFASRLVNRGHEVHVVTTDRLAFRSPAKWRLSRRDGIYIHTIPIAYNNTMGYVSRLAAFAKFIVPATLELRRIRADLVFATSTPLTVAIPAMLAKIGRRTTMVFEVRDAWPDVPIALGKLHNPLLRWTARVVEHLAYANSAHIVVLSPGMRDSVLASGYPPSQVSVIPNASDVQKFQDASLVRGNWRDQHTWAKDKLIIAYTGTLGYVNDVTYLADLASEVDQLTDHIVFVVIGDGGMRETLRKHASALGVLNRSFHLMEPIPKLDVPALLRDVDAAISTVIPVPILEANSANKFFEYLAAGKPVILNHEGWQADLLRVSGAGITVPPRDVASAARSVVRFTEDEAMLKRAGQAALELAKRDFDMDMLGTQLGELLELAGAKTGARSSQSVLGMLRGMRQTAAEGTSHRKAPRQVLSLLKQIIRTSR